MSDRWGADQVLALAPDTSGAAAGRKLAVPGPWSSTGACTTPFAVWGLCRGSGSVPYQTVVDLTGPAYRCSCPSRKFPCKHALGLLLLWSAGSVPDADAPADFAATWLAGREERATKSAARAQECAADGKGPADADAARRRAAKRVQRVEAGVDELSRRLDDQARTGLAELQRTAYAPLEAAAARLVDDQAPGLASAVRRLTTMTRSGPEGASVLLEELALLHLLTRAHTRLAALPGPLAATVVTRIGAPVRSEEILARPGVADVWAVLSLRDRLEDRLVVRRVHLQGLRTGRAAQVLSFAPPGQPLDATLVPGTLVDADLHFVPAAHELRALVGQRRGPARPMPIPAPLSGLTVAQARRAWASALAEDPWLRELPVVLAGMRPARVPGSAAASAGRAGDPGESHWFLQDDAGGTVPVVPSPAVWSLLAVGGGAPVSVVGDLGLEGIAPAAALTAEGLVTL